MTSRLVSLAVALLAACVAATACAPAGGAVRSVSSPVEVPIGSMTRDDEAAVIADEPPSSTVDLTAEPAAFAVGVEDLLEEMAFPETESVPIEPFGTPLPSSVGVPAAEYFAAPVALSLPTIGVDKAPIVPVGVQSDGAYDVPPARQVGWYRFGPEPGRPGSAVLAAHISSPAGPGVFRYLADLEPGDPFETFDGDGLGTEWIVVELAKYLKDELPTEVIFSKEGSPRLALVTCGGTFNRSINSYDSNIVAYALPADFLNRSA